MKLLATLEGADTERAALEKDRDECRAAMLETASDCVALQADVERLRTALKAEVPCTWSAARAGLDAPIYETSCGHAFKFTEDGANEHQFGWCPFCGGKLEVEHEERARAAAGIAEDCANVIRTLHDA